ncbi:hypothetical protein DNTS_031295 [Danionella cerebrum]|uniref:Centrosomal protein of 44 kDa n=1 Tax=Danionella cerebrum TaxID=2873325 RepID=A0A553Q5Z7_9TELE|nr:hypothetical protein DNTS_031295 [Danionella translucida]TRY85344.1 hypothetical protein DNTS_031295 [Danionella translucida]
MATGDLKGCLRKMETSLRSLKYPRDVDYQRLAVGDPSACLPIISFAFTSFSPSLAEHLVECGVELTGMNDVRFIENVYKVLRDVFSYKPLLTKQQFLQFGFAERKVSILCDIVGLVLNKHKELTKESKHTNKPKRRQPLKSCIKNEIPSAEWDSVGSVGLALQPLVEKHLGGHTAPVRIVHISDEHPAQKEESEKLSDDEHREEPARAPESTECVLASQIRAMEVALLESVGRLEQRLNLMENRVLSLEKSMAGKITIQSNQWENLESRVLLLETRLALTSAQDFYSDQSELKTDSVSASGSSSEIQQPFQDKRGPAALSAPTVPENFQERLDRIVCMMKDTSNILQNLEPTI